MSVTYPAALALLSILPLVVWLHLRRRRPRRVVVPALTPWLQLVAGVPPRRRRVPPTLLLALHLLAAAALALATLGPRLPGPAGTARDRALVVDRSASMGAPGRWPALQARARALLDATSGQRSLIALDDRPRVLVARDPAGRAAAAALAGLAPDPEAAADLDAALALARAAAGPGAEILVLGDSGLGPPGPGAPAARLERVGQGLDNLGITRAAARRAGGELQVFARVGSFADEPRRARLSLASEAGELEAVELELAPGDSRELSWRLAPASGPLELVLRPADGFPADDRRAPAPERDVLGVQMAGQAPRLERALAAIPGLRLERVGLADYRGDGSAAVSVFVGRLPERLPPGGLLWVRPEAGGPHAPRGEPRSGLVGARLRPDLLGGIELGGLGLQGLRAIDAPAGAEVWLEAEELPAILSWTRAEGRLLVWAFDPELGSLADRLAFPLLVARSVEWLAEAPESGGRAVLPLAEHELRTGAGDWPAPAAPAEGPAPGGRPLWPWLAGLALVAMLVEGVWRAGLLPSGPGSGRARRGRAGSGTGPERGPAP